MIIAAFSDEGFTDPQGEMSVYINPDQYTQTYEIQYNDTQTQGSLAGSPVYNKTAAQTVKFQLIFDGTGVVPSANPSNAPFASDGIATQMDTFLKLVFTYDGDIHSPNFIQITWGTFIFNSRLTTLNVNYTLFKPDGTPLRAKVDTTFIGYQSQQEIAKEEKKNSPDLSHMVLVKSADTLPDLCNAIYGDTMHYIAVARYNGLCDFRELTAGMKLLFPPLEGSTQ
jgi:nucleoid-associated protein YgaU